MNRKLVLTDGAVRDLANIRTYLEESSGTPKSIKKELETRYNNGFQEGYDKAKQDLEQEYLNVCEEHDGRYPALERARADD